jgi:hypothetical protein
MKMVRDTISLDELKKMSEKMYQNLVKAVVDISQGVMAVDAEFHSDLEEFLLEQGSAQDNLWGINLHPNNVGTEKWIEYDSLINIRPYLNNRTRYVENAEIRKQIVGIVKKLVQE